MSIKDIKYIVKMKNNQNDSQNMELRELAMSLDQKRKKVNDEITEKLNYLNEVYKIKQFII